MNKSAYKLLWNVVDGAVKDALSAHKNSDLTTMRNAINKRVCGQVLALISARKG